MVLVYLGKDVFRGTKEKPFLDRPIPDQTRPRPETNDEYELPGLPVYDQETQPSRCFTWSMGLPPPAESPPHSMAEPSETEGALDSSPAPPSKRQQCPRWTKKIVKEKVYKIRRGSKHCCKQCTLCHKYFDSQKELNCRTSDVHSSNFYVLDSLVGKILCPRPHLTNIL